MRLIVTALLFWCSVGISDVKSQEVRDFGLSRRGLVPDASSRLAAGDIATQIGLDCEVSGATSLGRGTTGPHYEVSCREGPGYLIIGAPALEAFNCLALQAQARAPGRGRRRPPLCRLPANQNAVEVVASAAHRAGLDCRVDEGELIGLSSTQAAIYEVGCDGVAGALIEQSSAGWQTTDCIIASAQGRGCRFTTAQEELATINDWLSESVLSDCALSNARFIGRNDSELFFEILCQDHRHVVAVLDSGRSLKEYIPCDQASKIGEGCMLRAASDLE